MSQRRRIGAREDAHNTCTQVHALAFCWISAAQHPFMTSGLSLTRADGSRSHYLVAGALFPFAFPLLRILVKLFPDDAIRRARWLPSLLSSSVNSVANFHAGRHKQNIKIK